MKLDELDIAYDAHGFVSDKTKNLYKKDQDECVFVDKLRKQIYQIIACKASIDETVLLMLDTFGDCYILTEDGARKFIFGIMGSPCFFKAVSNLVFIADSYHRIWILSLDGSIQHIVYLGHGVKDIIINDAYKAFVFDDKVVERTITQGNESKMETLFHNCGVKLYDNEYNLLYESKVAGAIEFTDDIVRHDGIVIFQRKEFL